MKIGMTMVSFQRSFKEGRIDLRKYIEYCGKEGYDSIDLLPIGWRDRATEESKVRGWAKKAGVNVMTYSAVNQLLTHDAGMLEAEMEKVRDGILAAAKVGAPYVRVFGGTDITGFTSASAIDHIIECLKSLMPMCVENKVTLAVENHGGYPGTAAEMKMVLEGVDHERLTCIFDMANWLTTDQDPVAAARELGGLASVAHVKDVMRLPATSKDTETFTSARSAFKLKRTPLGQGQVPVAEVLKALKAQGFDGHVLIEAEGPLDDFGNAAWALDYVRRVVKEV